MHTANTGRIAHCNSRKGRREDCPLQTPEGLHIIAPSYIIAAAGAPCTFSTSCSGIGRPAPRTSSPPAARLRLRLRLRVAALRPPAPRWQEGHSGRAGPGRQTNPRSTDSSRTPRTDRSRSRCENENLPTMHNTQHTMHPHSRSRTRPTAHCAPASTAEGCVAIKAGKHAHMNINQQAAVLVVV